MPAEANVIVQSIHVLPTPLKHLTIAGTRIKSLLLDGVDFTKFPELKGSFRRLKTLAIHNTTDDAFPKRPAIQNLQPILCEATELECLHLTFRVAEVVEFIGPDLFNNLARKPARSIFHSSEALWTPRLSWSSKLHAVELNSLLCTNHELRSLLGYCAQSLKCLILKDLVLMPDAFCGKRACLVSFSDWLRQNLALDEVDFDGVITNGGMQCWRPIFPEKRQHSFAEDSVSDALAESNGENSI